MNEQESIAQKERLSKYDSLKIARKRLQDALYQVQLDDPMGPHGQGPFTGNTRESRRVISLNIGFSATRGGSPATSILIENLQFEACDFGEVLKSHLKEKLAAIDEAIRVL